MRQQIATGTAMIAPMISAARMSPASVRSIIGATGGAVTAPLCSSANFAMGTDYNDFSSGQSCYGLNPATGAGLWVYFVGAVLALASVPMLLRN